MIRRPPGRLEREVVADLVMGVDRLLGSVDDIWSHPASKKMLETVRWTTLGIFQLVREGRALGPTRVIASTRALLPPGTRLHAIVEVVDHLLSDSKARRYWDDLMPDALHPHTCPRCGLGAYVGFREVECRTEGCG